MKQHFKTLAAAILLGLACLGSHAQQSNTCIPKWISEKGYWVVENKVDTPKQSTIYFYSNAGELVYQEKVTGKLKLHRRKTLMQMKAALETAVAASEKKQPLPENEKLFAGQ